MIVDVSGRIAKVIDDHDESLTVNFLEKRSRSTFFFSPEEHTVSKECASFLAERLEDTGQFMKERDHWVMYHESDDDDYVCSEEDGDSEDESLVDETELEDQI